MEEIKSGKILDFFGAANTYSGFVSYFDKIFPSEEFEKIYLLKGGPGTGKSSFMKAIGKAFPGPNYKKEHIFCSSDPRSLDGIIISKGNKKIAILDGTAPHERDAKIPAAVDEIIDLANSLDKGWLTAQRQTIISKSNEKSNAYKTAYNYMKIAGTANVFIKAMYQESFDKSKAKSKAECILQDIPHSEGGKIHTRLVSSFSRLGLYHLDTVSKLPGRQIRVCGEENSSSVFLSFCLDILKARGGNIIQLPCALDPCSTDAIYLPDYSLGITCATDGDVDANELFNLSLIDLDKIKKAKDIRNDALSEAQRWLGIASDIHFSLEKIYGQAMNFYKNDSIIKEKISEIGIILENER